MTLSKLIKVNLIFLNGTFLLLHIIVTLRHYGIINFNACGTCLFFCCLWMNTEIITKVALKHWKTLAVFMIDWLIVKLYKTTIQTFISVNAYSFKHSVFYICV